MVLEMLRWTVSECNRVGPGPIRTVAVGGVPGDFSQAIAGQIVPVRQSRRVAARWSRCPSRPSRMSGDPRRIRTNTPFEHPCGARLAGFRQTRLLGFAI